MEDFEMMPDWVEIQNMDEDLGVQCVGFGGEEVAQVENIEITGPYGEISRPPAASLGLRIWTSAGETIIAVQSYDEPNDWENGEGEKMLYSSDGCYVYLQAGKITVKTPGGLSVVLDDDANTIKIGEAPTKKVVLDGDYTDANSTLGLWMSQVSIAINALAPGSISPIPSPTPPFWTISTVVSSATKVLAD